MTPTDASLRAVVVNYNGGREVVGALRSIADGGWAGPLDLVVVDNGSTDDSLERIAREVPAARVVQSRRNLGYPAINQVIDDLDGVDLVAILNPDARFAPGALDELAAVLAAEPDIGATCPRILLDGPFVEVGVDIDGPARNRLDLLAVDGTPSWHLTGTAFRRRWAGGGVAWAIGAGTVLRARHDPGGGADVTLRLRVRAHRPTSVRLHAGDASAEAHVGHAPAEITIPLAAPPIEVVQNAGSVIGRHGLGINRGYHAPDGAAFDIATDVPAWCGAAALLRSEYLRDVGTFDPRWFLYYEDIDLSWRGLLRGWRHRYVPSTLVHHAHSSTIGHGSALYDHHHERNRLLTVVKCARAAPSRLRSPTRYG